MNSGISLTRKASCLLCEMDFSLPEDFDGLNNHLREQHCLLINKIQEIDDLPKYVSSSSHSNSAECLLYALCYSSSELRQCFP